MSSPCPTGGGARVPELLPEPEYQAYLANLLAGRTAPCRSTVERLRLGGRGVTAIYEGLFRRSLYDVGELWARREASVADEHVATAITQGLIHSLFPDVFSSERIGRRAVVSCLANERHELGGRMVADVLELAGWDTHFLGVDMPLEGLLSLLAHQEADLLALSLTMPSRLHVLLEALAAVREARPGLFVVVGGQAFTGGVPPSVAAFPDVLHVPSLDALLGVLSRFPRRAVR